MKIRYLFVAFCWVFVCGASFAQDWQPLKLSEKYCYTGFVFNGDIEYCIWIDSLTIDGQTGDTVFLLNRIVTDCDSCSNNDYKLANQAHFLKKKMFKYPQGKYWFQNPGGYVIFTHEQAGFSWIYDTANNITAEVIFAGTQNVFGATDSIKRVELSNDQMIVISKTHGIIEFPDTPYHTWHLSGINGSNVGDYVPLATDIFDYQAGDIFQWITGTHRHIPNYEPWDWYTVCKRTFLVKTQYPDSVVYEVQDLGVSWKESSFGMPYDSSFFFTIDTLVYSNLSQDLYNAYPYQVVEMYDIFDQAKYRDIQEPGFCRIILDDGFERFKVFGDLEEWNPDYYLNYYFEGTGDVMIPSLPGWHTYRETLGEEYYWFVVEVGADKTLMGYIREGDTTGTIYKDDFFFTGIDESLPQDDFHFLITPNPADHYVEIEWNIQNNAKTWLRLLNSNGMMVMAYRIPGNQQTTRINVSGLAPGIYLLSVQKGHKTCIRKLMIMP